MTTQFEKAEFFSYTKNCLFSCLKKVSTYSHKAAFLSIKAILLYVSVQRTDSVKRDYH